ncbi:cytochrome P450 [Sphingomonas sp. NBWT7]|uniref:cytochrome P450 n=1 Tax=Sphingomonas sp. NBWT7 TaxID=2596913 RepID=UPI00215614F0|nr:cytochrome P450 [Sphingomonas sp. NBWT7]
MSATDLPEEYVPSVMARSLTSPSTYANPANVHADLAWLRANRPVARLEAPNVDPFWLVTRHQDILDIERQADLFRNGDRSTVMLPMDMRVAVEHAMGMPHLTRSMVNMDGREHRTYRMLTQSWFMPGNIKKLTERIRAIARTHVDRMLARGGACDFVSDVALHYPLHVIMEILGVREEDEGRMLMLTQQLFGARDPELGREADAMQRPETALKVFEAVLEDFYAYFRVLTDERRKTPRDDVASIIANAVIDGAPIADHEANSYYVLVATAGHDTTSASTAGGALALARDPALFARVKNDPTLIPALVEEAVRWVTPVNHFMRTAARDVQFAGQSMREGDWIMLSYLSGNRDEAVFEDPDAFRLDRPPSKQLAFGFGPHLCLGQHLAKLEMRILFEELIPRLHSIKLAGEPAWTQSVFISGPKRLPVSFRAT